MKKLILHIVTMVVVLVLLPKTVAVASNLPNYTYYDQYPYIVILADGEEPQQLSDEEFFDHAAKIVFPVNQYDLPQNSPLLLELENVVIPHINSDSLRLVRMVFRGAASPEGPVAVNQRLGQQRVLSVYNFMTSRITANAAAASVISGSAAETLSSVETDIEDYRSLCIMMRRANDPDYLTVKALCDLHLPNQDYAQLKEKLQKNDGGRLWQRLLQQYFPQLRSARFVIYLQRVSKPEEPKPEEPISPISPMSPTSPISPTSPTPPESVNDTLPRREFLSIKTNLLLDVAYMPGYNRWCHIPNMAVEYYPLKGHFTFGASFDFPWWQHYEKHKFFQIRNYQLETRYYLKANEPYDEQASPNAQHSTLNKKPAYSGWYLQGYGHLGLFGICFDADRGWEGEGIGAGVGIGYVLPISRNGHWRLEFQLQAGWFGAKYDPYQYENPVDPNYHDDLYYYKWSLSPDLFKKRQYRFNWFGPTRIGVTLTYDLLYRRIQKKGVSFKAYEPYKTYRPYNPQERRTAE